MGICSKGASVALKNEKRQHALFIVTIILMSIYLLWRLIFTLPFDEGPLNAVFGILLYLAEALTVLTTFELFFQKMQKKRSTLDFPVIPEEEYPDVDVFIATHNEPVDLLYKTVNACTFMDYPDKQKVHIYICDDGGRPEVEELAKQFGVGYLGFPDNKEAKSGNYNNALSKTSSPLIATFDADMIPQHTFLMKTVPYFLIGKSMQDQDVWLPRSRKGKRSASPKIGLVQTPQSFYNPDLFQFNLYAEQEIPNEQDFFSREVNILRNASNAVAYTGSNTVISRQAMEEIGGFPLKTITEDFETSIRLQQAGYITYATDEVQAAGLTTTTIKSMIKQRTRWARGIIQSLQNTRAIVSRKLPVWTRVTYLSSFLYWWSFFNRLIFILAPILFALFDFKIVNTGFWEILIFWLPSYFCYSMSMRYLSSNIRNQRWSQVIDTIFMPYLILPVLLETLGIHERKFKVTNKNKSKNNRRQWVTSLIYALPHLVLLLLSGAAIVRFAYGKYGLALLYSSIILFWLVYNMVALIYALFFMIGRRAYRESERIRANEEVTITWEGSPVDYRVRTVDVSEQGTALYIGKPLYLPQEKDLILTVRTMRYKARLKAVIVYVKPDGQGWRYSAKVEPLSEQDKRQYMQIIYDRKHSLLEQMNLWDTAYDDMLRNIKKRIDSPLSDQRARPRIPLRLSAFFSNGVICTLRSFNYDYFTASGFIGEMPVGTSVTFATRSRIEIQVRYTGKATIHGEALLAVENIDVLEELGLLDQLLEDLTNPHAHAEIAATREEQSAR